MQSILLKPLKKRFIPLSSDDDEEEAIYMPFFGRKNLEVPRSTYGRSTSLSPIPQSPVPSPIEDIESPDLRSAPPSRDSSRSAKAKTKHLDWCQEEDCEICQYLINRKKSKNFFSSGVVADSSRYNASIHTLDKPSSNYGRSKSVDPTRHKPYFAKKLAQLDAAMKIIAAKVDQNVWEEKYLEAEELQTVMIWLRSVNRKLRKMLEKREKHVENYDFKAAQKAKEEYEEELKDAVDLSRIQHLLSPTEYSTLDGRTESYRAATMYRIDPVEESIPAATTTTTNENAKESPEVIRTRCCGLCSKKTKKKDSSKPTSKPCNNPTSPQAAAV